MLVIKQFQLHNPFTNYLCNVTTNCASGFRLQQTISLFDQLQLKLTLVHDNTFMTFLLHLCLLSLFLYCITSILGYCSKRVLIWQLPKIYISSSSCEILQYQKLSHHFSYLGKIIHLTENLLLIWSTIRSNWRWLVSFNLILRELMSLSSKSVIWGQKLAVTIKPRWFARV